jgi:DNA-binding NarL/FixJ family response regulator
MISMDYSFKKPGMLELLTPLSPAERMVATHLIDGLSNKQIASAFGKAEPTVKHQVSSILRSAKVPSRGQFIAFYYQQFFRPLQTSSPLLGQVRLST